MRSSPGDASWAKVLGFSSVTSLICPSETGGGLQAAAGDAGGAALLLWAFLLNNSHTLSMPASNLSTSSKCSLAFSYFFWVRNSVYWDKAAIWFYALLNNSSVFSSDLLSNCLSKGCTSSRDICPPISSELKNSSIHCQLSNHRLSRQNLSNKPL